MNGELTLCEELYASAIALQELFGDSPVIFQEHVQEFKRSQVFRAFLYADILRISSEQNEVPHTLRDCSALQKYADLIAELMLRIRLRYEWAQESYALARRQN